MRTSYDVIIVGAGSMGMSTGYYLARQGVKVLLLDAFDPPHPFGSHHGDTRLLRHAYSGSAVYTELALRSDQLWQELEQAAGDTLLIRSGVLNIGLADSPLLEAKHLRAKQYQLDVEELTVDEMMQRWPGIRLAGPYKGLYERQAGYLRSEACVEAFRKLAVAHSAVVLPYTPVKRMELRESGDAQIHTDKGVFTAGSIVLSLGAWFGVVEEAVKLPIRPVRKAIAWFEPKEAGPLFDVGAFPGFIFDAPLGDYYGFPSSGGSGVKIGRHDGGQAWHPGREFEPFGAYPEDEAELRRALDAFIPEAAGKLVRGAVCKYEMTPDEHFIIDRHPDYRNVFLCGGFSGHGFKFASGVGELLTDLITKGRTALDINPFALSRFHNA